jgi:hypothetical protein
VRHFAGCGEFDQVECRSTNSTRIQGSDPRQISNHDLRLRATSFSDAPAVELIGDRSKERGITREGRGILFRYSKAS